MLGFAQRVVKKYDKDGDSVLTKDEWSSMSKIRPPLIKTATVRSTPRNMPCGPCRSDNGLTAGDDQSPYSPPNSARASERGWEFLFCGGRVPIRLTTPPHISSRPTPVPLEGHPTCFVGADMLQDLAIALLTGALFSVTDGIQPMNASIHIPGLVVDGLDSNRSPLLANRTASQAQ